MDVTPSTVEIVVRGVFDSLSWKAGEIQLAAEAYLSCWVLGLPDNCDCANVRLWAGEWRLRILAITEPDAQGYRQINGAWSGDCGEGNVPFRVECGGVSSQPVWILLTST